MPPRAGREVALGELCWADIVRPGSLVAWGQASAEPVALTASLMARRAETGGFRAFVGFGWTDSVSPDHGDHVAFTSYCGTGANRRLGGSLDILPLPYERLAPVLGAERLVVLISLGPGRDADHFSFGAGRDYLSDLIDGAAIVIAEVSDRLPRSADGEGEIARDRIDLIIRTDSEPPAPPSSEFGAAERQIAAHVAGLIEDGTTLQIGLGGIPAAVLQALRAHRDIGIHSGMIGDEVADLALAGVITNARKTIDRGRSVTGLLAGSRRLIDWADGNAALALRPTSYTHDAAVLASIERLAAINSAIEVDLSGQINAEVAGGRYVGAVGGAGTFLRGAHVSRGGLPIVALPSTAGARSRIVAQLSGPVSTARSDAGIIVTEHGVADLRGLGLRQRRERLLAIADPAHAAALDT